MILGMSDYSSCWLWWLSNLSTRRPHIYPTASLIRRSGWADLQSSGHGTDLGTLMASACRGFLRDGRTVTSLHHGAS